MQTKKWTLMFYFASDNPLASTIVSQLKALKDAGYHPDTNVIAHFDPHAVNTPVHVFDVNSVSKFWDPGKSRVGLDDRNAFARDLVLDRLWTEKDEKIREMVKEHVEGALNVQGVMKNGAKFEQPKPYPRMSGEQNPKDSLTNFLSFCREAYPARHYALCILGHGQVVGNDTLLYDAHANEHSLKLTELGQVLRCFSTDVQNDAVPGQVDLVVLHSCSMSALEVAYELKGAANYMLASQGPMYVGHLPYKRILMRLFDALDERSSREDMNEVDEGQNGQQDFVDEASEPVAAFLRSRLTTESAAALDRYLRSTPHSNKLVAAIVEDVKKMQNGDKEENVAGGADIKETLRQIFFDCLYSSYDFQLAGYPFDMCLTDLTKVPETKGPIDTLVDSLINGLDRKNPTWKQIRQLILLAHLDAQSFYQEDYVDLYDFCFRLRIRCEERPDALKNDESLKKIYAACKGMMDVLEKGDDKFVVRSSFAGAAFQYSHGHSIYFPWKKPEDGKIWDEQYPEYRLTRETKWREFLSVYFQTTERDTRAKEMDDAKLKPEKPQSKEEDFRRKVLSLLGRIGANALDAEGRLQKVGPDHPMGKYGPDDPSGASCNCPSIKNYPAFTGEIEISKDEVVRIHTDEDFLEGVPVPQGIRGQ